MYETCTLDEIAQKLGTFKATDLLLDVRTDDEFKEGHVPGSKNISHDEVAFRAGELKSYEKIYIFCQRGRRAQVAVETLEQMGFKNLVCVKAHGMAYWIEKGFPVEK